MRCVSCGFENLPGLQRCGRCSSLLDLSRLEAGASALELTDVPLAALLTDAAAEAKLLTVAKGLSFVVDVRPAELTVPADADRLHQVLTNLLANATRHSPQDGEVRIEASRVGPDIRIDVVDQGPGIAPEQRAQVFERFVRGNSPAVTGQISTGGTGLGLAIVRWAVTLHGGRIEVADSPGGCTMRVSLPARRTAPGAHPADARVGGNGRLAGS